MRAIRLALVLGITYFFTNFLLGQALYVKPVKVLGDPNFIGTASNPLAFDSFGPNVIEGREVSNPVGVALDTSVTPPIVYIADTNNNRVLGFQYGTQLTPGAQADVVLGQPDRFSNLTRGPGTNLSTGLHSPTGLAVDSSGNLYVADTGNNRIVRYPKPMSQPPGYQFPDLIIGQTSFGSSTGNSGGISATTLFLLNGSLGHTGVALDPAGNLWVTDSINNRVLRYPAALLKPNQNGPAADLVIGQTDMVSRQGASSRTSKTAFIGPNSLAFDPSGRMFVGDALSRVLVFPAGLSSNGAPAIRILGIAPTTSGTTTPQVSGYTFASVTGVAANDSTVFVADSGANRIVIFGSVDSWPVESDKQISPFALNQLGQTNLTDSKPNQGGEPSASTLDVPADVGFANGELFVTDTFNNRVLVYPSTSAGTGPAASRVIGQLDFADRAPNLTEGKEFFLSGSTNGGVSGMAVLDLKSTPIHVYVADTLNNRVLGFNDFQQWKSGQKADLVIGQPDFSRTTVNYPGNNPLTPNAQGLNNPSALALDSAGNLYVADTFNSRVLRFPAPFASGTTALETADLVIGQNDFTSIVGDPTARTLNAPTSIAFTQAGFDAAQPNSGFLMVTDPNENRVLFFPKPFSSGMSATKIIGQPFFTSNGSGTATTTLNGPRAAAADPQDRILVVDTGNARVQAFDAVQNLPASGASALFSVPGFSNAQGIGIAPSGQFWVADVGAQSLLHFPGIDQLPLNNYSSDARIPVTSPRSVFVDSYSNVLATDGINRVLYYAPGLAAVNAANFISGRPLAAGTFAAVFPAVKTNTFGAGTAAAQGYPLPTTLADTQILVNGTAAPLLYVSPGQINVPLPMNLPTGGTVDLQVVGATTGQILATGEVQLASASPGLFTTNSGTGQVAAINVADGSINSFKSPVARGQYVSLFGTGQGSVPNAPPDGEAVSGPVPTSTHPQILLGGTLVPDANIQYSGLAPYLAGVWQINVQIPATVTPGNSVPLVVLMNSIRSDNQANPAQIAVTLAVK